VRLRHQALRPDAGCAIQQEPVVLDASYDRRLTEPQPLLEPHDITGRGHERHDGGGNVAIGSAPPPARETSGAVVTAYAPPHAARSPARAVCTTGQFAALVVSIASVGTSR